MLEKVNYPKDLKKLNIEELNALAKEIRELLIKKMSIHGGHFGPNLGIVDLTIALHYVFDTPKDKLVFDVSHQTYTHKILTGRKEAFIDESKYDDVSGLASYKESEYDTFTIGHTSTALGLASGLAKARDIRNTTERIVAIVGDGSLGGGEALEGLNNLYELNSNFIAIINDNDMSIAENHGGLYYGLKELRETNGQSQKNIFKAMGLDYMYVNDGHNIEELIEILNKVKDTKKPLVLHIKTIKGFNYEYAINNEEMFHYIPPFDISTGKVKYNSKNESYEEITANFLLKKMQKDPAVAVISAGVPVNIGFTKERRLMAGKQFIDVGIMEECAIAMASGMAKNGAKPVFSTHSSFIQRTYDQLSQDLCLNNSPVTILITTASIYGMTDATHLGIFDISMMSNIPNLVYLAPTNCEEYLSMLNWSIEQNKYPVAIKVPCNGVIHNYNFFTTNYDEINKYEVVEKGKEIAIIALGDFFQLGEELNKKLKEKGIKSSLINPRYITGLDTELLDNLKENHQIIITLEDGILNGGFGEKIASYYGKDDVKVYNYGLKKEFIDRYNVDDELRKNHLTVNQIIEDVL